MADHRADEYRELLNAHHAMTILYSLLIAAAIREAMLEVFRPAGDSVTPLALGIEELTVFVVFVLLASRFFLGNVRHMDATYVEPLYSGRVDQERTAPSNRLFDFGWMVVQAILVFYLGTLVGRTRAFFTLLTLLLTIDVLWLLFSSLRLENVRVGTALSNEMVWVLNNFVHVVLFVFLFTVVEPTTQNWWLAFALVGMSNSVIDFSLTWDEYFPPVGDLSRYRSG